MTAPASPLPLIARPPWRDRVLHHFYAKRWRGFFPLQRLLRPDGLVRAETRYGAVFALSPFELIDAIALLEGFYESEVFEALRPFFAPGRVFWDIGANIGLHAISAARVSPGLVVCAIEPNPRTLERLRTNLALNAADITLWPGALGEHDGSARLSLPDENCGMSAVVDAHAGAPTAAISLARADTLVAAGKLPAPNIVKLDVEGYEANVLAGFGALLARPSLQAIVFETAPDVLANPDICPATRQLLAAGFRLTRLVRREQTAHLLENYLAVRP